MEHVRLPEEKNRRLVFYLAMEEYLARYCKGEAFFAWQSDPTVIIGRNQVMAAEVNLEYCREKGIQVWRRKSGGGCVYSDRGNIMFSYITDGDDVPFIFDSYLRKLALCLRRIGIAAEVSGRNDLTVGGQKISGNAFYSLHGRNVIHGTMLFDSSFEDLGKAITPSVSKLQAKGVSSVRQRVANLKGLLLAAEGNGGAAGPDGSDGPDGSGRGKGRYSDIETFKDYIIRSFCSSERTLLPPEMAKIEEIEQTYLEPDFLYGSDPEFTYTASLHLPQAGTIDFSVLTRHGVISSVSLTGDWLALKDGLQEALNSALKGVRPTAEAVAEALQDLHPETYAEGLDATTLARLLSPHNENN